MPGWADAIDVDRLDLDSCFDCVLGQLYNDFDKGRAELKIGDGNSIQVGFCPSSRGASENWREYRRADHLRLDQLWTAEILARQAQRESRWLMGTVETTVLSFAIVPEAAEAVS